MSSDPIPDNVLDFGDLFEEEFSRVYRYFRIRVGDDEMARDLTSETFLRAFDNFSSYDNQVAPFGAWLFGIARNLLTDTYRRNARRESQEAIQSSKHSGDMDSPEVEVLRSESLGEVEHAMEFLDARERDVIALKFGAALTNKEIAAIYGISPANSAVILHRAIKKLRRLLGAEIDENG